MANKNEMSNQNSTVQYYHSNISNNSIHNWHIVFTSLQKN